MDRGVIFFVLLVGIILLVLFLIVSSGNDTSGTTLQHIVWLVRPASLIS